MIPQRRSTAWLLAVAVAGAMTAPSLAVAQFVEPPPPAAYALHGITLVQADGTRQAGVTIVIRDGMIEAMGPDVPIPVDAEMLEGDSLMVLPGLIDAQGSAGYEFPDPDVQRSEVSSWSPPRSVQSFVPHRAVVDYLTATGEEVADQRKQGVIAAAVHAEGRLMPGRGTLLILRKDAATPRELVVTPMLGPVMSFRGAPGVYPSQVFAVMAFIRQSFEDARRDGIIHDEYSRDPRGMQVPAWDPDYAVLRDVMSGSQPVYFMADEAEDIRNVLVLADEYGFRPVIVGGGEAWKVAASLREASVPVLVSLDFPTPTRWEPESDRPDSTAAMQEETALDPGAQREKEELEDLYSNAARLAQAGVTFALTSGGGSANLRDGVRKAMEYGLDEQTALAAVTATPAELLGIPHLVRIEEGMAANFVVTDGEPFDEDANVAYTFVAGTLERGRVGGAAAAAEAPAVDMTGTWQIVIDGEMTATMTLTQEETGSVSGTFSLGEMGSGDVSGSVSGNDLTFTIAVVAGGQTIEAEIEGTVTGNSASGNGTSSMGDFSWTAERRSGPPGEETLK